MVKPDLIKASNTQTAKVSLDDCLACSGCVTSAETVLITQQSAGKLREAVESGRSAETDALKTEMAACPARRLPVISTGPICSLVARTRLPSQIRRVCLPPPPLHSFHRRRRRLVAPPVPGTLSSWHP